MSTARAATRTSCSTSTPRLKTLHSYIAGSFLTTFAMALLVLSFVMSVGLLFKATEYIAAGASGQLVARFLWSGFPGTLSLSIPIAALVSALLVFGRLSSDSEISAMRACGIRLVDIMRMPVLLAALLTLLCLHLNASVAPNSSYARKSIRYLVKASDLLTLIQPGRFVDDFPGYRFYVGSREGSELREVRILETMRSGRVREIKAQRALVSEEKGRIRLEMFNVTMDPLQDDRPGVGHAERAVRMVGDLQQDPSKPVVVKRRVKDQLSGDLLTQILTARLVPPSPEDEQACQSLSQVRTEYHKRIAMSLACLCFVALGIPLGIKAHRRESSAGIILCLAITAGFYLMLIASESLGRYPLFLPHLLAWLPVGVCAGFATFLVAKNP